MEMKKVQVNFLAFPLNIVVMMTVIEQNSEIKSNLIKMFVVANLIQPVFQDTIHGLIPTNSLYFLFTTPPKLKQYKLNCSFIFYG